MLHFLSGIYLGQCLHFEWNHSDTFGWKMDFFSFLPGSRKKLPQDFQNKWFPWAFWWNLFEFFCNGDLPMTFARPRGFARRSLGGASLRSVEPRFARRDGLASLGWRPLKTGTPSGEPSGGLYLLTLWLDFRLLVWFHQKENIIFKKINFFF